MAEYESEQRSQSSGVNDRQDQTEHLYCIMMYVMTTYPSPLCVNGDLEIAMTEVLLHLHPHRLRNCRTHDDTDATRHARNRG